MATLAGGAAGDSLEGAIGNFGDVLFGMGGNDTLRGHGSLDTISGGDGDDLIEGGRGTDRLSGGKGNDTFLYTSRLDLADERITDFGAGDRIDLTALGTFAWLQDSGFAGAGNEIRYRTTTVDTSIAATEILIDVDGDGRGDASIFLHGVHRLEMLTPGIITLSQNRALEGTAAAETLTGGVGRDTLRGFAGDDSLNGGSGNDRLLGGSGADTLNGSSGTDTLLGQQGDDTFVFTALQHIGGDQIRDFEVGDLIHLAALGAGFRYIADGGFTGEAGEMRFANSFFSIDADGDALADRSFTVTGIAALEETFAGSRIFRVADVAFNPGTAAADTLVGGAGADTLLGGEGLDLLSGGGAADSLVGGAGADTLVGGAGNDRLEGGDGNDLLIGGYGGDTLTGGAGNDTFRVLSDDDIGRVAGPAGTTGAETTRFDTIGDFSVGDVLDLSVFGALTIVGTAFTENPGEVTATYSLRQIGVFNGIPQFVSDIALRIDVDGDGIADGGLTLVGTSGLLVEGGAPGQFTMVAPISITGSAAGDNLAGQLTNDTLSGVAGADTLSGLGGADSLEGGDDADLLQGGDGNDTLRGGAGSDTLVGGAGVDLLDLGSGDDVARFALADLASGFDSISGFGLGDLIDLSALTGLTWAGSELAVGAAPPAFSFGASLEGGIVYLRVNSDADVFNNANVMLIGFTGALEETAVGSRILRAVAPLTITDGDTAQTITGGAAADNLSGAGGNDTLIGNGGADTLLGGSDDDRLLGGSGNDSLSGGAGADTLVGGLGIDTVSVDIGDDTVVFGSLNEIGSDEFVLGIDVGDRIDLSGAMASLTYIGTAAFSNVAGQMRFNLLGIVPSLEIDTDGNGFRDRSILVSSGVPQEMEFVSPGIFGLAAATTQTGDSAGNTLTGFNNADTLSGMNGNDTLFGSRGTNLLDGGANDDLITGGINADTLIGGAGADTIVAGGGIDSMMGGDGADLFRFSAAALPSSTQSVFDLAASVGDLGAGDRLDFSGIPGFIFIGSAAFTGVANQARLDFLTYGFGSPQVVRALLIDTDGNGFHDRYLALPGFTGELAETGAGSRILAAAGAVSLTGTNGADTLTGGTLNDTINGGGGSDSIRGGAGADSLDGVSANDRVFGEEGADTIIGGSGADTLSGGAGVDIFVFGNSASGLGAASDLIVDFAAGTGEKLNLFAIDANLTVSGNQAFTFIGDAAFTALGQLRFAGGVLQANNTGTTAADFEFRLTGVTTLTASDLVL